MVRGELSNYVAVLKQVAINAGLSERYLKRLGGVSEVASQLAVSIEFVHRTNEKRLAARELSYACNSAAL